MVDEVFKTQRKRPTTLERAIAAKSVPRDERTKLVQAMRAYLRDRSPTVRWEAIQVVGEERLHELESQVLELLGDKRQFVRDIAVSCLGHLHEGQGTKATWLYPCLEDTWSVVRIETIESLAQIGDRSALPLIAARLADEDEVVRSYAAATIADLSGFAYEEAIRTAMASETEDRAKVGLAEALFLFGDVAMFGVLLGLLLSPSYTTRCAAANTIDGLELTRDQLETALTAVSYAARHALYRGDGSTMEEVERSLLERVTAPVQ